MQLAIWIPVFAVLLQGAPPQKTAGQKPAAQAAAHGSPFSADVEENATDLAGNMRDIKGKMYVSRPHVRMDMQQPGHSLIILLVNTATHTTDMLYPEQHKYVEVKADPKSTTEHGSGIVTDVAAQAGDLGVVEDDRARVLYLAPTKALAGDQLRTLHELDLPWLRAAAYDGDTPLEERDWVRAHANWVLTNPDMLHRGILPTHQRW